MIVKYKNTGRYLNWSVDGETLILDNTLHIGLSSFRGSNDNTVYIYADKNGAPSLSVSDWYLAEIIIPRQTYTIRETGEVDATNFRQIVKTADSLDMESVTITLWAREE